MARIDFIKRYLGSAMVLDVGCAGMEGVMHRKMRHLTGGRVCGVDVNIKGLEMMKLDYLVCADARCLPFGNGVFDCVVMAELLEHMWDARQALFEARRVLKYEGTLVITTPNAYSLTKILSYALRRREVWGEASHATIFTPVALAKLLQKCGFEPVASDTSRKFHIPFTSRTFTLNIYGLRHMGEHICVAAKKI